MSITINPETQLIVVITFIFITVNDAGHLDFFCNKTVVYITKIEKIS